MLIAPNSGGEDRQKDCLFPGSKKPQRLDDDESDIHWNVCVREEEDFSLGSSADHLEPQTAVRPRRHREGPNA